MGRDDINALLNDLERYLKAKDRKDLPNGQRAVLHACLCEANLSYKEMSGKLKREGYGNYGWKTLKNDGYNVFKRLSSALKTNVRKNNCHHKLLDWYRTQQSHRVRDSSSQTAPNSPVLMNLLRFKSWEQDLAELTQAIHEGHHVVCISASAKMGKTCLTHLLIEQIRADFDTVIHCHRLERQSIEFLMSYVEEHLPPSFPKITSVTALLELLQSHRLLLVVDHTEVLLQSQQLAGRFNPASLQYEHWLQQLLTFPTLAGCLIWVGREPPACFNSQYSTLVQHQVSRLWTEDVATLLDTQGTSIKAIQGWETIVEFCGGNPAWLMAEASLLARSHTQNITSFLAHPAWEASVQKELRDVLSYLSDAEHRLLFWFVLKPIPHEQLHRLASAEFPLSELETILASLWRRDLIHLDNHRCYRLNPPLLEHILAQWVVERIAEDLLGHTLTTLSWYPLFHGTASAERQQWQTEVLLRGVIERLNPKYPFRHKKLEFLQSLLRDAQQLPSFQQQYAIGNVLNLAVAMDLPFSELEISGSPLCHVDLRRANLRDANLAGCVFEDTLLPLNLAGKITVTMAASGNAIAAGDSAGHLAYWQREGDTLKLLTFRQFGTSIDHILMQREGTLVVISHRDVFLWWLGNEAEPEKIMTLPEPASCLSHSNVGHIAVGLVNGNILLWDEISRHVTSLSAHRNGVCNLAFRADSQFLASIGFGNRVLVWRTAYHNGDRDIMAHQEIYAGMQGCLASNWFQDSLMRLAVDISGSRIVLRIGTESVREHAISEGTIIALKFSRNGQYLAGSSDRGLLFCWAWQTGVCRSMTSSEPYVEVLAICEQGRWLLATQANRIQLFDLHKQELVWQSNAGSPNAINVNVQDAKGLTAAEHALMQSFNVQE